MAFKIPIGKCSIYTMKNPVTNEVFYVGRTFKPLDKRLWEHLMECKTGTNSRKNSLLTGLIKKGRIPIIEEVEDFECRTLLDKVALNDLESYWIDQFRQWGFPLVNTIGIRYKYVNLEKRAIDKGFITV
jgi:hypothetical protein